MDVNIFTLRSMTAALVERVTPKTFILDTFFPQTEVHETETVDIDVERGKAKLAAFVNPLSEGRLVEHERYQTYSIKPPYMKEKMVTIAQDYFRRPIGANVYSPQSPAQRAAAQLAKDLATLEDRFIRREEWMATQALFTGSMTVTGEGYPSVVIDFNYSTSHDVTLTGTASWDDPASTPLQNIRDWKQVAAEDSGLVPTDAVLGATAAAAFLAHAEVKAELNRPNQFAVKLQMDTSDLAKMGVVYIGEFEQVRFYTYAAKYLDEAGSSQNMVPAEAVLLGSRNARAVRHYGAIQDMDGLAALKRFPKSWIVPDPSARFVMLQSASLPVPHQIDAFVRADVINA